MVDDCGCSCARSSDVRAEKCSKMEGCGIVAFLESRRPEAQALLDHLKAMPAADKTAELRKAEAFLGKVLSAPADAPKEDPCLKVGDALIALESCSVGTFY